MTPSNSETDKGEEASRGEQVHANDVSLCLGDLRWQMQTLPSDQNMSRETLKTTIQ